MWTKDVSIFCLFNKKASWAEAFAWIIAFDMFLRSCSADERERIGVKKEVFGVGTFPPFPLQFVKHRQNPILQPQGHSWEAKDVFNPGAIVKDDKVYLLYRAEDHSGRNLWNGTSRIGLAVSRDGFHFERLRKPVLFPTETYEHPGGCEDPRIVRLEDTFVMTYTGFDGKMARLCLATSQDLLHWEKHGVLFPAWEHGPRAGWSKSGAIVPYKIQDRYIMYFGDSDIWIAFSEDGIHWQPQPDCVMRRRADHSSFDSLLIEPGPPPVVTDQGILLFYNAARTIPHGPDAGKPYYSTGQVLFSLKNPKKVLYRSEQPIFIPETEEETHGQINHVVFAEGLVYFRKRWFLYYGMADSRIGVAQGSIA